MANKVKFTTPFGVARYPHISKPDTVGKYADNKFKTKLAMPAGDPATQKFVEAIKKAATDIHGAKGLKMYMPFVEDEEANEVVFTFKTQYAPAIFDAKNKAAKGVTVGGGSVIRLMGQFVEFDKGISAQFNQVQIKELNGFGSSGFEAIDDGYEFDQEDAAGGFDSASDDTSDDAGANESGSALDI